MLQRTFEDIGDDLHVPVSVRLETSTRPNAILVDHAQDTEAHMLRIVILAEGEGMPAVEPTEVGYAACFGRTNVDRHGLDLLSGSDSSYGWKPRGFCARWSHAGY
jgi:hypothetical protein